MGKKTKIDWCDATWNPVTGCLHGCKYCYARGIAQRFGSHGDNLIDPVGDSIAYVNRFKGIRELYNQLSEVSCDNNEASRVRPSPYPYDFEPTFHRYRLDEPLRWTKPRAIFVCSMADLSGEWVPDDWIKEVFATCDAAPQHRYLFLTKNPARYTRLLTRHMPSNMWFGWSQTGPFDPGMRFEVHHSVRTFVSIEPLLSPIGHVNFSADWVIIGAETGNRRGKVIPRKEWVMEIVQACREAGSPVFMKESLRDLMGADFRQEMPWMQEGMRR